MDPSPVGLGDSPMTERCPEHTIKIGEWTEVTLVCHLYPDHRGNCRMELVTGVTVSWPKSLEP